MREHEYAHACVNGVGAKGERENPKQALWGSWLHRPESLDLETLTEAEIKSRMPNGLSHPGVHELDYFKRFQCQISCS